MIKDTLLIGDQSVLKFRTTIPKDAKLIIPQFDSTHKGLEVIGTPVIDTISKQSNSIEIEAKIMVTSFDSGSYFLPKLPAYLQKVDGTTDTVWFDGGKLEYKTIQIDTTTYKPYDIKGQMQYPYTVKEFLPWAALLLLIIAAIYGIRRYFKSRKSKKGFFNTPEVEDPPHVIALKNLEKIKSEMLWQNNKEKLYYTYITDVLRSYIESRYNVKAMEFTSNEILRELAKQSIDKKLVDSLSNLLYLSDLVKFAKYKASIQENEEAIPIAVKFVNSTFLQDIEQDKKS